MKRSRCASSSGKERMKNSLWFQVHLADATGDAVVISAGKDGELAFTRKQKGDKYLISTNFNVANPENCYNYPCWRYDIGAEMMDEIDDVDDFPKTQFIRTSSI